MRRQFAIGLILAGLGALVGGILFWFDPARYAFYPQCLLHQTTGLLCPGCGSLRALHQLLHGHWLAALRFNALLVLGLPLLVALGAKWVWLWFHQRPLGIQIRPLWLWVFLCAALIFGVCRNWPGSPLAMLPQ